MRSKTLVLDFDGVLHSYESGWKWIDVIPDGPVPGAVDFLVRSVEEFSVAIYSARSSEAAGREAMAEAINLWIFNERGIETADHVMSRLQFPEHKPAGFVAIDDRALTFTGVFPPLEEIHAFKPWNKR